MLRRILGLIILIATVVVLIALIATAIFIRPAIDAISTGLDNSLSLTVDALETVSATLSQTQSTLSAVNESMDTAGQTTTTLSKTFLDTIPLLDQVSFVVAEQTPQNIEAVQAAVPNVAAVAGVVDDALVKLSDLEFEQTIPIPLNPVDISFDLGIDYEPAESFDETMLVLGTSLDGLPDSLRALGGELETSAANLETLSGNLDTAAGDIAAINAEVAKFIPLLDEYLALLDQVIVAIEQLSVQVASNLATVKLVATILPLALALTQLAPLVVGWDLLTGKSEAQVVVQEAAEQPAVAESSATARLPEEMEEDLTDSEA
jgi:hypothetical protein